MDTLTRERRSYLMSRVRRSNTKPELLVRQLLHALGCRFRLHVAGMPGRPDIVMPRRRAVVFVQGCFWHRHKRCVKASTPASNAKFWSDKFARNVNRDRRNFRELRKAAWQVIVVWECETKNLNALRLRLTRELRLR